MSDYIVAPGARIFSGPGGRPYESLGDSSPTEAEARAELAKMRASLKSWRRIRRVNDEIASGKRPRKSRSSIPRNWALEQQLATNLHNLLGQVMDPQALPNPNVTENPNAAVELATVVIDGKLPASSAAPVAQGILPFLIGTVGVVVLLGFIFTVKSKADAAKEEERLRCIREGNLAAKIACSEPSSLIAYGLLGYAAYWTWTKGGLGQKVTQKIGKL